MTTDDLRHLGDRLRDNGDVFGAYLFKVATYHLADDSTLKRRTGFEVVDLCLGAGRYSEAERMVVQFAADFPNDTITHNALAYRYGYSLMLDGQRSAGDVYLRPLQKDPVVRDRVLFLRARSQLIDSRAREAGQLLRQIDLGSFPYADTVRSVLRAVDAGPTFHRRRALPAALLSAVLPGAGQIYAGHHFDAIQAVIVNGLFGQASYLAWKYDVADRRPGERHYTWPVLSTVVFAAFYATNIWNAANGANRYNRHQDMQYYDGMIQKLDSCKTDTNYFVPPMPSQLR